MSVPEVPRRIVDTQAVMPSAPPLISCLMLTRGRLVPTRFAIDCYRRQTWPNRELVIVCDDPDSELPDVRRDAGRSDDPLCVDRPRCDRRAAQRHHRGGARPIALRVGR